MAESPDREQALIDKFKEITSSTITSKYFSSILQCLKRELYNKNYMEAFGNDEYLDAYLARYVPSRAIVYYRMIREHRTLLGLRDGMRITSIGGGAGSELSGLQHLVEEIGLSDVQLSLIDIGKWDKVVDRLQTQFKHGVDVEFLNKNVLTDGSTSYDGADIITILFTISELFIQSKKSTLQLLNKITEQCRSGTKLVIAESVGLSNIEVGGSGREYPLTMILDHTLQTKWKKVCSDDSKWFRLSESIDYPIKLENARCIVRIYEKI